MAGSPVEQDAIAGWPACRPVRACSRCPVELGAVFGQCETGSRWHPARGGRQPSRRPHDPAAVPVSVRIGTRSRTIRDCGRYAVAKNVVIVESPSKAKTIEKYLGDDYKVVASYGHVRDLPRSDFAVDVNGGDASLRYEVPKSAEKVVGTLKREIDKADNVFLATDLDREGEAIAWHVAELAEVSTDAANRVVFSEITRDAILAAFEQPREIDEALVDAQQARRAVDRIVGYRLSPTLWRNVASGISAGRVQSVALRLICDREDEIRAFVPEEYWTLEADFDADGGNRVTAKLHTLDGRRVVDPKTRDEREDKGTSDRVVVLGDQASAREVEARTRAIPSWTVTGTTRRETRRNPQPPFITSTLQGEASSKLGFTAQKTMRVAQQLYEGINLGDETVGLITYMRTDSVNLAASALGEIGELVRREYGERYALDQPRRFTRNAKGAQEAHEAIRPTGIDRRPREVAGRLDRDQLALYDLIWKRTVATQMAPAVFDNLRADVVDAEQPDRGPAYRATGQVLKFDGFLKVYRDEDDPTGGGQLPELADDQGLELAEVRSEQHETQPPPRYTERRLIEVLEEEGIGRPSTYAQIIQVLVQREYVRLESRRFFPTPLGEVVTAYLKQHFSEVVDVSFTARMEAELDEVAQGRRHMGPMVSEFLGEVDDWIAERKPERPRIPIDGVECPTCGAGMEKVFSGKSRQWFASCSRWPECDGTLPLDQYGNVTSVEELQPDESVPCPECGKGTIRREGRFGPFYGCQDYPKCRGIVNVEQRIGFSCPKCEQGQLVQRMSRYGKPFYGCNRYPDCDFALWTVPLAQPCPHCGGPMKPPRRNAKNPTAQCAKCDEKVPVDPEPERVTTEEYVPGRRETAAS
ncbi:type I DNA topoisomerase [Egibacter rhizosphaerae]|uniref:type I DNA topoisomerase n=1 Tax=Egibacter rhizosphaerae TaxID=1670831 RepID=UPI0013F1535C|nr:type I DNA topoisomerase [Egibacter rhizosphaerae]